MQPVQFISTTPDQLQSEINAGVKIILEDFLKNFKPKQLNEYLTRRQVADMFGVDISTIHNWCKSKGSTHLGLAHVSIFYVPKLRQVLYP